MALGFRCILPCGPSQITISAIFGLSWKLVALRYNWNRYRRTQYSGGSTLVLHNVRHVLELSRPLILVGQLDEDGIRAGFSSGGWTLYKGNLLLAREPKVHSLYLLYITLRQGDLFLVDIPVSSLWQRRLRHLSKAGITPPIQSRLHPQTLLLRPPILRALPVRQTGSRVTPDINTERIEPAQFGPLKQLWPDATSVSRRCFVLRQFH